MKGDISQEKSTSGRTTHMLTRSGRTSASDLGASSPSTMCRKVITAKATPIAAALCVTASPAGSPTAASPWSMSAASAGSPIQPSASEAR